MRKRSQPIGTFQNAKSWYKNNFFFCLISFCLYLSVQELKLTTSPHWKARGAGAPNKSCYAIYWPKKKDIPINPYKIHVQIYERYIHHCIVQTQHEHDHTFSLGKKVSSAKKTKTEKTSPSGEKEIYVKTENFSTWWIDSISRELDLQFTDSTNTAFSCRKLRINIISPIIVRCRR